MKIVESYGETRLCFVEEYNRIKISWEFPFGREKYKTLIMQVFNKM